MTMNKRQYSEDESDYSFNNNKRPRSDADADLIEPSDNQVTLNLSDKSIEEIQAQVTEANEGNNTPIEPELVSAKVKDATGLEFDSEEEDPEDALEQASTQEYTNDEITPLYLESLGDFIPTVYI